MSADDGGSADLQQAWARLQSDWARARSQWDDRVRQEFERTNWAEFAQTVPGSLAAMRDLEQALAQARRHLR